MAAFLPELMNRLRLRASDAQRAAVWEFFNVALADGRLNHFEHFERTRVASRAEYIDELRTLTEDLRGGDAELGLDVDQHQTGAGTPVPANESTLRDRDTARPDVRAGLIGTAVALALALGSVSVMNSDESSQGAATSVYTVSGPGPLHTEQGLERVVASAQADPAVSTLAVLFIGSQSASLMHENPTDPGTWLNYAFYNDEWDWEQATSQPRTALRSGFSIADLDPALIATVIEAAPGELDMPDAPLNSVLVLSDALGAPEYTVSMGDEGRYRAAIFGPDGQLRRTS